jgi:hypothetical protein
MHDDDEFHGSERSLIKRSCIKTPSQKQLKNKERTTYNFLCLRGKPCWRRKLCRSFPISISSLMAITTTSNLYNCFHFRIAQDLVRIRRFLGSIYHK